MNALHRLVRLCAEIADGLSGAQRPPRQADRQPQQGAYSDAGEGATRMTPSARDDKINPPSNGSHPAVWPR